MQQEARLPLWFLAANCLLVAAAFALGAYLTQQKYESRRTPLPEPQESALRLVFDTIRESYVEPVDEHELADTAIGAMARLDAYSVYVPAEDVGEFVEQTTGSYDGIGLVWHSSGDRVLVHFPMAGGPSDRAGIMPGDEIVAVDGRPIAELLDPNDASAVVDRIRGPSGTRVELTMLRGEEQLVFDVERASVQKPAVRWAQLLDAENGLGYVHVADFHPGAADGVRERLGRLRRAAPSGLRGLVLDLRFDGGGNLDEALAMARLFLARGRIVTVQSRAGETAYDAGPDCPYPDLPMVVLVNGRTASASEVVTCALRDHDRAAVVGTRTFGKGQVQTVYKWRDLDFRLKLTTARYRTPNGTVLGTSRQVANDYSPHGLEPDVAVPIEAEVGDRIQLALAAHEPPERYRDRVAAMAAQNVLQLPAILPPDQDPQLAAALATLRERAAAATAGAGSDRDDDDKDADDKDPDDKDADEAGVPAGTGGRRDHR